MAKMKALSGKEVCVILENYGFNKMRQRGSHIVMQKQAPGSTITVLVPDHKEIRIGKLLSIIRQSGLSRSEFE